MKYDFDNYEVNVKIVRKNNKNAYFRIDDDFNLVVTCPKYMNDFDITNLIKTNEEKLEDMYERNLKKKKDLAKFYYLGKSYDIVLVPDLDMVGFKDGQVFTPSDEALDAFKETETLKVFNGEIKLCKKCFNDLPEFTLKIRKMHTRWGVCNTRKKQITLNNMLLEYELWVIDYVIIHEMCHFYEGNHGKHFWELVEAACPRYKEAKAKLKE